VLGSYEEVTTKGCFYYGYATFAAAPTGTLLRAGWDKNEWIHRFFEGNMVADAPIGGPMLIVAGEADQTVLEKSTPDQLAWIRSRFAGETPTSNCGLIH